MPCHYIATKGVMSAPATGPFQWVNLWDSAGPRCQQSTPRGDSHVIIFPMSTNICPASSVPGPGETAWVPAAVPSSGIKPSTQLLAREQSEGSSPWGGHFPRGREGQPVLPHAEERRPASWGVRAGGEATSSAPASPPPLLADAVHVCPARSSPPHPEHFPQLPWQHLGGSGSPGQRL